MNRIIAAYVYNLLDSKVISFDGYDGYIKGDKESPSYDFIDSMVTAFKKTIKQFDIIADVDSINEES